MGSNPTLGTKRSEVIRANQLLGLRRGFEDRSHMRRALARSMARGGLREFAEGELLVGKSRRER